jgi:hypothetical protein
VLFVVPHLEAFCFCFSPFYFVSFKEFMFYLNNGNSSMTAFEMSGRVQTIAYMMLPTPLVNT